MPKLYQIWPGNNRFLCGCCVTGPGKDWIGLVVINFCMITILVCHIIFIHDNNWSFNPALPILLYVSLALMNLFMYLAACSDPGILPRRPFALRDRVHYQHLLKQESSAHQLKQCQTCFILKPKRASHCSRCQNCVQIFDHHCSTIGNCIGKRNYRFFTLFLATMFTTLAMFIANLIVFLLTKDHQEINKIVIIVFTTVIATILGLPILAFFSFHLYVAISGQTTREIIKKLIHDSKSQENRWCGVDRPYVDFQEEVSQQQSTQLVRKIAELRGELMPLNLTQDPTYK